MMKALRKLLNRLKRNTSNSPERYWESIDEMPLHNWIKCNDGKINFIRKKEVKDEGKDEEKWNDIFDQYIQRYGLSEMYLRLLKVLKEKALLELDYVKNGEKFKITLINIQENKLQSMISNNGNGLSINEALIHISKWVGYRLNPMEITVVEYFNILKEYGKANKQK